MKMPEISDETVEDVKGCFFGLGCLMTALVVCSAVIGVALILIARYYLSAGLP